MNINLYPYSKGDPSVGIGGWDCLVTIETPSDELEEGDLEFFKKQVMAMYEAWDCDDVDDDIGRNNIEIHENEMEIYYIEEEIEINKTNKDKKVLNKLQIKVLKDKNKELEEKNKELEKLFRLEKIKWK